VIGLENFFISFGGLLFFCIIAILSLELLDNQMDIRVRIFKRFLVAISSLFQGFFAVSILTPLFSQFITFLSQIIQIPCDIYEYTMLIGILSGIFYIIYMDKYFFFKQQLFGKNNPKSDPKTNSDFEDLRQFLHTIMPEKDIIFFEYTDKFGSFGAHVNMNSNPREVYFGQELNQRTTFPVKQFVVAHEISHSSLYLKRSFYYLLLFFLLLFIADNTFVINSRSEILAGFLQIFVFFIVIIFLHWIQWKEEYRADAEGAKITNAQSALDFFSTAISYEKEKTGDKTLEDFGLFNIFLFSHPMIKNRMEKIRTLSK
jgi:hypothetical protein